MPLYTVWNIWSPLWSHVCTFIVDSYSQKVTIFHRHHQGGGCIPDGCCLFRPIFLRYGFFWRRLGMWHGQHFSLWYQLFVQMTQLVPLRLRQVLCLYYLYIFRSWHFKVIKCRCYIVIFKLKLYCVCLPLFTSQAERSATLFDCIPKANSILIWFNILYHLS